jgi:hypothetical protein
MTLLTIRQILRFRKGRTGIPRSSSSLIGWINTKPRVPPNRPMGHEYVENLSGRYCHHEPLQGTQCEVIRSSGRRQFWLASSKLLQLLRSWKPVSTLVNRLSMLVKVLHRDILFAGYPCSVTDPEHILLKIHNCEELCGLNCGSKPVIKISILSCSNRVVYYSVLTLCRRTLSVCCCIRSVTESFHELLHQHVTDPASGLLSLRLK